MKLPPGRRPKKGQKHRMNEWKKSFVSYMSGGKLDRLKQII